MDTVSSLPFKLHLIKKFPVYKVCEATIFYDDEMSIWKDNIATLSVEENDEIELLFDCEDKNAKLYLDALDIIPYEDTGVGQDENGELYRIPSKNPFVLYKSDSNYEALRVDIFKLAIICNNKWYYGIFEVIPKPIKLDEWKMMRDDLESEITGLAQDIVRKNIGIGNIQSGIFPPEYLYDFFVIKKYAKMVIAALVDINEKPRYTIHTQYEMISDKKNRNFDKETVKRFVTRGGAEATYKVPQKVTCYDIQDNRILKMILCDYEKRLGNFLELLSEAKIYSNQLINSSTAQYKYSWQKGISEFYEMAHKLSKITGILKTQDWYLQVSELSNSYIPHSFVLDTRYNVLYQMYLEIKNKEFKIALDPMFSYTWKRSSYLYEMWCYIKICRLLSCNFKMFEDDWKIIFSDKILFPFLEIGRTVRFENENTLLQVIFDKPLSFLHSETDNENPLFIAKQADYVKAHNRPDILINIFDKRSNWYVGSIVIECKYRKMDSFFSNTSRRSSLEQLEAYYNNARSEYLYGKIGKRMNIRPVRKVLVVTPDIVGDGKTKADFNIWVKGFKPTEGTLLEDNLFQEIRNQIEEVMTISRDLQSIN